MNRNADGVPFTAVIEMTALVDPDQLDGNHLVYLPRYVQPDDPIFDEADESIQERFVSALDRCHFILSDSGGVQEEAPTLRKPVLVTRESTERPEAMTAGATRLVGTAPDLVVAEVSRLLDDPMAYQQMLVTENPYGRGDAADQILNLIAGRWNA